MRCVDDLFPDNPRISIVGAGAIGGYFGALLSRAGMDVRFLLRRDFAFVKERGITIQSKGENAFTVSPLKVYEHPDDMGECDLVIVSLKTTSNMAMKSLLPPLLGRRTVILTLQNGLGNIEYLIKHFGRERVIGGLCFIGLNRESPGFIRNYIQGGGYLTIGEAEGLPTKRIQKIATLMQSAKIDCRIADSIQDALWRKLIWNVPFNGLAIAGGGITTDQILKCPQLVSLAMALMKEIQAAAAAAGFIIPDSFLERQFPFTEPMGAYKPSSLIDFIKGREVEVEAIFGEPLRQGTSLGTPMPHLQTLYALLYRLAGKGRFPDVSPQKSRA
jgi:2-dehydropantoate 2-reductase